MTDTQSLELAEEQRKAFEAWWYEIGITITVRKDLAEAAWSAQSSRIVELEAEVARSPRMNDKPVSQEVMQEAIRLLNAPNWAGQANFALEQQHRVAHALQARDDKLSEREAVVSGLQEAILGLQEQLSQAVGHIRGLVSDGHRPFCNNLWPKDIREKCNCGFEVAQVFLNGLGNTMERG